MCWILSIRQGTTTNWKVLNAKDFGVPQNRERVFIVSIRKDIDNMAFQFPIGFRLKLRLKDILEDIVDEKYYLSEQMIEGFNKHKERHDAMGHGFGWCPTDGDGVATTLQTTGGTRPNDNYIKVVQLANLMPTEKRKNPNQGRLYDKDGLSPTLGTMQGGSRQPFVIDEPMAYDEQNGYIREDGCVGTLTTDGSSPKHNNRVLVWDGYNQRIRADQSCVGTLTQNCGADLKRNGQGIIEVKHPWVSEKGVKFICDPKRGMCTDVNPEVAQPITASGVQNWTGSFVSPNIEALEKSSTIGSTEPTKIILKNGETMTSNDDLSCLRIRKLTPKECFRLMAFDDEDFEKAEAVNSNTQLYKQAGNSIVVQVIEHIFMALTECGAFRN